MATVIGENYGEIIVNDDSYDSSTIKLASELQLHNYGKFLESYSDKLHSITFGLSVQVGDNFDFFTDPILLQLQPSEQSGLLELVTSDNKILKKIIVVFASICAEIKCLKSEAETKFYPALALYGEGFAENSQSEADIQIQIGSVFSLLQDLSCYVNRCAKLVGSSVHQLAALYHNLKNARRVMNVTDVHFQPFFEHLGELLATLITLDEIITNQLYLHEHWSSYKRLIKQAKSDPAKFGLSLQLINSLPQFVANLENQLFKRTIFKQCVEQSFDSPEVVVSKNSGFLEEFAWVVTAMITQIDYDLNELNCNDPHLRLVGCYGLYVLLAKISQTPDKKMFRLFWDINKKVPIVNLVDNVVLLPDAFLTANVPEAASLIDRKAIANAENNRSTYLQTKIQLISKETKSFYVQISLWMIKMAGFDESADDLMDELNTKCSLVLQGLALALAAKTYVLTMFNLHSHLSKSLPKSAVMDLTKVIEMLKALETCFFKYTILIVESAGHIVQHLAFIALTLISNMKKRMESEKHSDKKMDVLSALLLAELVLNGPATQDRILIAQLALCVAFQQKSLREEEQVRTVLNKLRLISNLLTKVRVNCDCSFLYWYRAFVPVYFSCFLDQSTDAFRIHYMCSAVGNCVQNIMATRHHKDPQDFVRFYEQELNTNLDKHLLAPLSSMIETDLRLSVHSHLQLDSRNPFKAKPGAARHNAADLLDLVSLRPVRLLGKYIDIKSYVEMYLDETIYNLTTVALHDWKTYAQMVEVAKKKYDLNLLESNLPSQTLEQGLDVLEIMRNIQLFVAKYYYNLNNQIFVERLSSSKYYTTINIRHIANSIRTHGTGIMNTTVNFTYQFLRKKFYVFSQFLFDEHIKSRLIKDIRNFKEHRGATNEKYPFDRAEKFNKDIRKLGLTPDGLSFLDQFRLLITQIGNAMGYIRMIRSGGLHCCSSAVCFIPDLEEVTSFSDLCKDDQLSEECQQAAKNLDDVIANLGKNFAEGSEYFKLLVDVFASVFRNPKNMHLRNFYVIIPPLTVNFVEHMIVCKDKISKKNKTGASFTDDGFAMGVAYCLKLLDQYDDFESLNWFQSVHEKYSKEKSEIKRQLRASAHGGATGTANQTADEKLQQTLTLTLNRLDQYQREFDLLFYSLRSAGIFFRASRTNDEAPPDKEQKADMEAAPSEG